MIEKVFMRMDPAKAPPSMLDLALAGAMVLASVAAIGGYAARVRPGVHVDVERYVFIAYALRSGDWPEAINYHYFPGFPILIALASLFTPSLETAARGMGIGCVALTAGVGYFLGRRLFGRLAAALGAGIFAFRTAELVAVCQAEQASILFLGAGLLLGLWALERPGALRCLATGAVLGFAFLIKGEALANFAVFVAFAAAIWLGPRVWSGRERPGAGRPGAGRVAVWLAAAVVGYLALAGPFLAKYYLDTGIVSANPKAKTLFFIHNYYYDDQLFYQIHEDEHGPYTTAQRVLIDGDKLPNRESLLEVLWKDRAALAKIYAQRFFRSARDALATTYLQTMAPWAWPLLLGLGLWPGRDTGARGKELYLHGFAAVPVFLVPVFSASFPRFYFPLTLWLAIVLGRGAGRGLEFALGRLGAEAKRRWTAPAAGLLLLALAATSAWGVVQTEPDWAFAQKIHDRAGLAKRIAAQLPAGCRFLAPNVNPSLWYAGGLPPSVQENLPTNPLGEVVRYARVKRARYIVFHSNEFPKRYSELAPLLEEGFSSPDLIRRVREVSADGTVYAVYQVVGVNCGGGADGKD